MSYDSSGNMTYQRDNFKDLTKTITVDSQNRITQVQDALSTTIGNYWYDEGGFRVRKKALVPSGASFKNQEILYPSKFYGLEYSEETNILSSINNVYLNGVRIAALNEDGVTAYFLTDQVDSVAHVLDEGAHTLSRMQYEPYGETLVQRGTLDFAPKYNSQELDRETNFYFYNARYYDPQIARFTSADTLIDGARSTQGWNRFSYVAGNPIRYKDPTGHEAIDAWNAFIDQEGQFLKNTAESLKGPATAALFGMPGVMVWSGMQTASAAKGTYDIYQEGWDVAKKRFSDVTINYQNLLSDNDSKRDDAIGRVSGDVVNTIATFALTRKIPIGGELPSKVAKTFANGEYTSTILTKDTLLYRYHGGVSRIAGPFLSFNRFINRGRAINSLAIKPEWGNKISKVSVMRVPKGTKVYIGKAASQTAKNGQVYSGGGSQVYIPKVKESWVVKTKGIKN
ncbi:RHS repeat-associated core domain protein [Leptospira sp. B5-022]|nr:RHS repeat-associated core domain protein [Leptospira sp. B5-022]